MELSKLTMAALFAWFCSACTLVYQGVKAVMYKGTWKMLAINDVLDEQNLAWINKISVASIQNGLKYIADAPMFIVFACVGVILFILGYFIKS
jgi:hypothetical protein